MLRILLLAASLVLAGGSLSAQDSDGPPISITSPDTASTFAFGELKQHELFWDKKKGLLTAHLTFVDEGADSGQSAEDSFTFRLPGVTFDAAKGLFYATTAKGEMIPVAKIEKKFFVNSVVALPNARVRVIRLHSNVSVVLEAIRPDDPAMHAPAPDPNGTHQVDISTLVH